MGDGEERSDVRLSSRERSGVGRDGVWLGREVRFVDRRWRGSSRFFWALALQPAAEERANIEDVRRREHRQRAR